MTIATAPLTETPVPSPERILQTGLGFWASKTLLTAVELGLFTVLADGPLDAEAIRSAVGLHGRSLTDFLDTLVALHLLDRTEGVYRNTPEADLFLDRRKPSYQGGILEMANARLYPIWGNLTEALRTGKPQSEVANDPDFFGELYRTPERLRLFLQAMTGISMGGGIALAQKFPWATYQTVCDVGTAEGAAITQIIRAHSHLVGTGFDLPPVKPVFEAYVAKAGLCDRLAFIAGDFFTDALPKADVILMGHILHDWGLETKRMLIAKAYEALPVGGALIVHEAIIDDERRHNAFGLMMSLNMLVETPEGFDFTGQDCIGWMREAGFQDTYVESLVGPDSIVVGIK